MLLDSRTEIITSTTCFFSFLGPGGMTDALTKLLIEKGVITDAEFKQKLLEERAVYQRILNPTAH